MSLRSPQWQKSRLRPLSRRFCRTIADRRAMTRVSSRNRFGRTNPRGRFRIPTSTVELNASNPRSTPHAACHAKSRPSRSTASRSDKPSNACSTITVASTPCRDRWPAKPPTACTNQRNSHHRTVGAPRQQEIGTGPRADPRAPPSDSLTAPARKPIPKPRPPN